MIETSADLLRSSSAIFGKLQEMFRNVWKISEAFLWPSERFLEKLWKSSESGCKSLENHQKHCHYYRASDILRGRGAANFT